MTVIVARRGTSAQWASANPVLATGELGVDTDTDRIKLGDGATAWSALPYASVAGPATATDNALVRFDSTTGKIIQNSVATLSDAGLLSVVALTLTGTFTGVNATLTGTLSVNHTYTALSLRRGVLALAASATLTVTSESFVDVTAGATSRTITLPSTTTPGYVFTIMKVDSGVGTVVVAGTINGVVNRTLTTQYNKVTVRSTSVSGTWLEV